MYFSYVAYNSYLSKQQQRFLPNIGNHIWNDHLSFCDAAFDRVARYDLYEK